jgi:hypothetical protein
MSCGRHGVLDEDLIATRSRPDGQPSLAAALDEDRAAVRNPGRPFTEGASAGKANDLPSVWTMRPSMSTVGSVSMPFGATEPTYASRRLSIQRASPAWWASRWTSPLVLSTIELAASVVAVATGTTRKHELRAVRREAAAADSWYRNDQPSRAVEVLEHDRVGRRNRQPAAGGSVEQVSGSSCLPVVRKIRRQRGHRDRRRSRGACHRPQQMARRRCRAGDLRQCQHSRHAQEDAPAHGPNLLSSRTRAGRRT